MWNLVARTEVDTATVPLYMPVRAKGHAYREAGEVAVFAAVTAAIDKVRKVLEALSGCYSWVIARVLG